MIGVDIIDPNYSFAQSTHALPQLKGKILNDSEFQYCHSKSDLDVLWTIKESAYKVWSKLNDQTFYNPKRIHILNYAAITGKALVEIHGCRIYTLVNQSNEYIYSISSEFEDMTSCKIFIEEWGALTKVKEQNHFSGESKGGVAFIKHSLGFDHFMSLGTELAPYSRSHHGRFYFSAILQNTYFKA